ncbi:hypothetical protein A2U01_0090095, partial [Trifolium medium]|nr:hypothetical protein [Trifolium medium]
TSAVKWVIRLLSAHRRRTSVFGAEGWGIGLMFVGRGWSASTVEKRVIRVPSVGSPRG